MNFIRRTSLMVLVLLENVTFSWYQHLTISWQLMNYNEAKTAVATPQTEIANLCFFKSRLVI